MKDSDVMLRGEAFADEAAYRVLVEHQTDLVVKVDTDNRTVGVSAPCSIHAELECYIDPGISVLFVGKGQAVPREIAKWCAASLAPSEGCGSICIRCGRRRLR